LEYTKNDYQGAEVLRGVEMSERTIRTVDSLLRGLIALDIAVQFMASFHIIPVDSSKYVVQRTVVVFLLLGFYFLWGSKPKWQKVLGVIFLLLIPLTLFFIFYVRADNFWYS